MKLMYGLVPKETSYDDPKLLAEAYVDYFKTPEALEAADVKFTRMREDTHLNKDGGRLWEGVNFTDNDSGGQDLSVVRRAADMALGALRAKAR